MATNPLFALQQMPDIAQMTARNAMLDLSPINQAIDDRNKQRELQRRYEMEQQRLGMEQTRLGFEGQRVGMEGEKLGFDRAAAARQAEQFPLTLEHMRGSNAAQNQSLQDDRQRYGFRADLHPFELEAKRKSLQTDPLMVVPDGANVLNRNSGQYLPQPEGAGLNKVPEHVAKAAGFTSRMVDAEDNVRQVMASVAERAAQKKKGFDPTKPEMAITNAMPEAIANLSVRDPEHQRYRQAAEQWIRAFLRKESGAAIGKDEFARDFVVYFPQPGDKPDVLKQKEQARYEVMKGFHMEGRPLLDKTNPSVARRLNGYAPTVEVTNQPQAQPAPRQSVAPPQPLDRTQRAVPDDAVKFLLGNPTAEMIQHFDQKYGPGSAKRYLRQQ